ncbi:MAG: hypothetical protein WC476_07845 [Phycisphaerae bacterium]|jgi:type II secretory pathway pseudopilin PulG
MRAKNRQSGLSLMEEIVVVAIIAILVAVSLPAVRSLYRSIEAEAGTKAMISAALSNARAIAAKEQRYAGVRFQRDLDGNQYMIFIIYGGRDLTNWICGFVAVKGYKPIKLPENIGVIDKIRRRERTLKKCGDTFNEDPLVEADLSDNINITDTSTFSIIFSPAGKLVIHEVRCRRRNDNDDIFSDPPIGMFLEDYNNDSIGIGVENSRRKFYMYERKEFESLTDNSQRFKYLDDLKAMYINPYTGTMIDN